MDPYISMGKESLKKEGCSINHGSTKHSRGLLEKEKFSEKNYGMKFNLIHRDSGNILFKK